MVRHVVGVPELAMRAATVAGRLEALEADEAVWCLDQLIRGALWGDADAMEAMLAAAYWLVTVDVDADYGWITELFEAAYRAERASVVAMLRDAPPVRGLAAGRKLPEVRLPLEREITLGERRMMASERERKLLDRLLMDPSPLVIGKLLSNPQLRVRDVLVIAARRPTVPELVNEVACHPVWFRKVEVREALARNPFGPTGVALKILPTLPLKMLRQVAGSGELHELVQEAAGRLVRLREERTAPWRV
ncbi:hypothetical protein DL240_00830 [Lujinxingia litoralis]|uniref:DUF2336 domain-containing protein n=2 Tax=Lujinxingia litoralis TaxID=2211119 RepID=A0A328C863_9DELT|nr:hypothetical protein DL240_00830 [Lujinxingia litoralis]